MEEEKRDIELVLWTEESGSVWGLWQHAEAGCNLGALVSPSRGLFTIATTWPIGHPEYYDINHEAYIELINVQLFLTTTEWKISQYSGI